MVKYMLQRLYNNDKNIFYNIKNIIEYKIFSNLVDKLINYYQLHSTGKTLLIQLNSLTFTKSLGLSNPTYIYIPLIPLFFFFEN